MSELDKVIQHLTSIEVDHEVIELEYHLTRSDLELFNEMDIELEHVVVGSVLCGESKPYLVIVPYTYLIDPASMSLKLSTKFTEVTEEAFPNPPVISEFGYIPLPKMLGLQAVVENTISKYEWVYLAIEDEGGEFLVKLEINEFKKAIGDKAIWENFALNSEALGIIDPSGVTKDTPLGVPRFEPAALKRRLDEQHEFPVMAPTAQKILKLQSDPNTDIEDLARVVEQSPTLAAQVIKWANSPYYGFPGSIKTIHDAIVKVLGFDMVMNMALGLAIGDKFKAPLEGPIGLSAYWQHSICTAALVEHLIKKMPAGNRPLLGLAYLTGLLHNFGYMLLGELFPAHFNLINQLIPVNPHLTYLQVERCVLGVCHTHLGGWLMDAWHMPGELVAVTLDHHTPIDLVDDHKVYVALTSVAVSLLARLELGDAVSPLISDELLEVIGLSEGEVEKTLTEIENQYEELVEYSRMLVKG